MRIHIRLVANGLLAIASIDASASTGAMAGIRGVARSWLGGAKAQVERQRPGMAVTVHVGQISFAADRNDARCRCLPKRAKTSRARLSCVIY